MGKVSELGNISVIFTKGIINSNIPLALKTVAKLEGFILYNQPGRTTENESCKK